MSIGNLIFKVSTGFNYLRRAVDLHGIHSPFVFSLVKDCVYDERDYQEYSIIEKYRNELKKDHRVVQLLDLGAGSRKLSRQGRKISEIVRTSSSSKKKAELLFRLSKFFKKEQILELGTNLGIGTLALHLGHTDADLITVEGDPFLAEYVEKNLPVKSEHIDLINSDFDTLLPEFLNHNSPDLIYIDGNHRYEPTMRYFRKLIQLKDETVLLFDDIYWSPEMEQAWNEIKKDPGVSVTVDLYMLGIAVIRAGQKKQDFVVRF